MRILGIDPGLQVTGFGLLEAEGDSITCHECGTITTSAGAMASRLRTIFLGVRELLERFEPQEVAIEEGFYGRNVKVAMGLGQARGVVLLACALAGLPIVEYSPREVKLSTVGNGAASKEQVSFMITSLLRLAEPPEPLDISDALAVAYCHLQRRGQKV
ncbi:MAG: crossover junction endodeoxyribonuclease RuvC [bacterium]